MLTTGFTMGSTESDWTKEKLEVLLDTASHAIDRARYVFIVLNVTGISILAGIFNAAFPWLRNSIERARGTDHLAHLEKVLYEDLWVISFPLIGIKISVFDLSFIGPTALLVLAIWQYYCSRRENDVVHLVCVEAKNNLKKNKTCAEYLYIGIAHHFVFTTKFYRNVPAGTDRQSGAVFVIAALLFMPAWLPFVIAANDVASLMVPLKVSLNPNETLWSKLSMAECMEAIIRCLYAVALGLTSLYYCVQISKFDGGTRDDVDNLRSAIKEFE
jgi:hypothetical protein